MGTEDYTEEPLTSDEISYISELYYKYKGVPLAQWRQFAEQDLFDRFFGEK